jgi:hypothetical protein
VSNREEFIQSFLKRRQIFASGCKKFFPEKLVPSYFNRHLSILTEYIPYLKVVPSSLPQSFVSGRTSDLLYWTDGAVVIRKFGWLKEMDVIIEPETSLSDLMLVGERVKKAVFLFNLDLNDFPVVLLLGTKKWRAVVPAYLDYAIKLFRHKNNPQTWISEEGSGCVITDSNLGLAYIAEFKLAAHIISQVDSLMRHLNEICRYRP